MQHQACDSSLLCWVWALHRDSVGHLETEILPSPLPKTKITSTSSFLPSAQPLQVSAPGVPSLGTGAHQRQPHLGAAAPGCADTQENLFPGLSQAHTTARCSGCSGCVSALLLQAVPPLKPSLPGADLKLPCPLAQLWVTNASFDLTGSTWRGVLTPA